MFQAHETSASPVTPSLVTRPLRWPLARRLSVVFVGLLALVTTSFGVFAYRGVREMAVQRATERLSSVARELAGTSARSSAARAQILAAIARDSVLVHALSESRSADVPQLSRALDAHRQRDDSTWLANELWDATTHRRSVAAAHGRDSAMMMVAVAGVLRSGSVSRSPAYDGDGQVRLWTAVPVRDGDRVVGALAEQRRIAANTAVEGLLTRLTGLDLRVYITTLGSADWASLLGQPIASPIGTASLDALQNSTVQRVHDAPAGALMVAAANVTGTPWRIVVVQKESSILERPQQMLVDLFVVGVVCVLAGAVAALWLSEIEIRPIAELRRAAVALAAGDYTQRVEPAGVEETAALADAFNRMAEKISTAHAAMAGRNAELQHAIEAKSRFLAVMSHELRTPLNAISGHAELLSIGVHGPLSPAQREAVDRIGRNKEQLFTLVTDILHYARQEASALPVVSEPVSLGRQFSAVEETVIEQFERKGVRLSVEETTAWVCADPVRVQQVLINLVTNALQFTPPGGEVDLTATPAGDDTIVRVRDTGVGIAPAQQAAIFEPFVQVDSSLTRRAGGAGLGLSIVRQLVSAMGGQVRVESAVGQGATFEVLLPGCDPLPAPTAIDIEALTAGD